MNSENINKETQLEQHLRMEIARNGQTSTLAFSLFSIFVLIRPLGTEVFKAPVQWLAVFALLALTCRYFLLRHVKKIKFMSAKNWNYTRILITLNAVIWSLIFTLGGYEHQLNGFHYIVITTMVAGFVGASIVTLSHSPSVFVPFQILMLGPQTILIVYFSYTESMDYLPLIFLYIMYFAYQLRQSRSYRQELVKAFEYQYNLEQSNRDLKSSQEALLQQTAKLLHTSRLAALGELSASIAHEVNNPLMVINGSVSQIKRIVQNSSDEQLKNDSQLENLLGKVKKSGERVSIIFGGLKHFSLQSDTLPKEKVKLDSIVRDTYAFSAELLKAHYIEFQMEVVPDVNLFCHPVQISQVLINLLKNAVDALTDTKNSNNGIEKPWIKIQFTNHTDDIEIRISNSGPKIPQSVADKLFQPFFTTKPSGKGTGLGLSISMTIIEEHQGELSFDKEAEFTTFKIKLPKAKM